MNYETVVVGALETNCYLVFCDETRECAVIDPGAEPEKIFSALTSLDLKPVVMLNTHGHVDHIGANADIKEKYGIPLGLHSADLLIFEAGPRMELGLILSARPSPAPDRFLEAGDAIEVGRKKLRVIHTPGHSPGSVSFLSDGILFSGDTLFSGGVGRTDLPGGSQRVLESSIREKIFTLPDDTVVLPGHGPKTTVIEERESNPFLL